MSDIFSLTKESSIPVNVFASTYARERYVESSIDLLTKTNDVITEQVKTLYSRILEADNAETENAAIKEFIEESQAELDKLSFGIKSLSQRFAIALSNYCDSVKGQVDMIGTSDLSKYCYKAPYVRYERARMLNSDAPQMNPYKIFEREFNFIGQLMQDLPVTASNKDKLEIVSTVYKNFKKSMDNVVVAKTYQDLFGLNATDLKAAGTSPSIGNLVCGMFKSSKEDEHNICIDEYTDAVECINSCEEFIDCINQSSEHLTNELKHIISDLNDILMGDAKNKFKVDTKEDGIRNTSYSIDKYVSNKILWLVHEKIQQIVTVFNKYMLALSVKMECILSYVRQSADIINSFTYMSQSDKECPDCDSDETSDNDTEDDDFKNADLNNDGEISQEEEDETKDDNALDGGDDILTNEDETEDDVESTDGDDSEIEDISADDEPEVNFEPEADEGDELREAVLDLLTSVHEYNMLCEQISIMEYAATILTEEEGDKGNLSGAKEVIGKAAEQKQSAWQAIVSKILKMWNSFKDALKGSYTAKVEKLKDAGIEKYVKKAPVDVEIKMPTIDVGALDSIKIEDLNYDAMKDSLNSKEDFIKKYYNKLMPRREGDTISKAVEDMVIDREHLITRGPALKLQEYWAFVLKYPAYSDELKSMTRVLEDGQRKAAAIAKDMTKYNSSNEGATLEELYFNEESKEQGFEGDKETAKSNEKAHEKDEKVQKERSDITKHMSTYFSVSGDILHAKIVTSQKVFNEFYAALMWHCNKMKEGGSSDDKKEGKKKEETPPADNKVQDFD